MRTPSRIHLAFTSFTTLCLLSAALSAADKKTKRTEKLLIPQLPATAPAESIKKFETIAGFEMQLVASEPQIQEPIVIQYDENGLLFVAEYLKFPWDGKKGGEVNGRIRLLRDDDGNGHYEKSTVFADDIAWPTGIQSWKGGIFVVASPDLWYLKDTTGDGIADLRQKIYTGFGFTTEEGTANNLIWGLDNWIYGAGSGSGGEVRPADQPNAKTVSLRGRDFRFDPVSKKFEALSGSEQFGNSFDDWNNRFLCQNSKPGVHVILPARYLARNPYLPVSKVRQNIWQGDRVYRASPPEPWRVARSKYRRSLDRKWAPSYVADDVFTAVSGVTIYRGAAYPEEFRGNIFFGEVQSNLIHRRVLTPNGVSFDSKRVDENTEIVRSKDNWFRPTNLTNAPDGTLHIADMYREVIETPTSMTPEILAAIDLQNGHKHGRIYRLAPAGFKAPAPPKLGSASIAELVKMLENPNGWWRDTAQRLIYQRQDKAAIPPLLELVKNSSYDRARLHALHSLARLDALDEKLLLIGLSDPSAGVREHALKLAEPQLADNKALQQQTIKLAQDEHARVRFQAAFSLGEISNPQAATALAGIASRDAGDYWMRTAILSSSLNLAAGMIEQLLTHNDSFINSKSGQLFLRELSQLVGSRKQKDEIMHILKAAETSPAAKDPKIQRILILGLGDGLVRSRSSLTPYLAQSAAASKLLTTMITRAKATLDKKSSSAAQRQQAIKTLAHANFADAEDALAAMLNRSQSPKVQLAALNTLTGYASPQTAKRIASALPDLSPAVQKEAVEALLGRKTWIPALLDSIANKKLTADHIDPARRAALMKHKDESIRQQAQQLFASSVPRARDKVIAAYQPALQLKGDNKRGETVAQQVCIACHQIGKIGNEVGPNLATIQNRSPADLMTHILDPNREVQANYRQYIVELNDGRSVSGFIVTESPTSITLKRTEGIQETLLRQNIKNITSNSLSLMPEGLEQIINQQQMSDLLSYLLNLKK
ncbi:MAG: HEAT repeat domain-containing protein [Verrucomicrobiota bacterium]